MSTLAATLPEPIIDTMGWYQRPDEPGLYRRKMSWQEYLDFPSEFKIEWIDGEAISMMAPANSGHGGIVSNLLFVLRTQIPQLTYRIESGIKVKQGGRIPDLAIYEKAPAKTEVWIPNPLILVEVLSPSTRKQDLTTKAAEYSEVGALQYWIADPKDEWLEIRQAAGDDWLVIARLDANRTEIIVPIPLSGSEASGNNDVRLVKLSFSEIFQ